MVKPLYIFVAAFAILAAAGIFYATSRPPWVGCTLVTKVCPDGSAVGRHGPNCEFDPCPVGEVSSTSYLPPQLPGMIACTQEARICPDGSAVSRTGPNCEFAPCPPVPTSTLSESEARAIAEAACIKGGEALSAGIYNWSSKTWWFDANLNATRPGCSPACVVSDITRTAEVNWRCTGALIPN